jgi:hypothetical protein
MPTPALSWLDQIINLVQLAGKIDWDCIDGEIASLYSEHRRPGNPLQLCRRTKDCTLEFDSICSLPMQCKRCPEFTFRLSCDLRIWGCF